MMNCPYFRENKHGGFHENVTFRRFCIWEQFSLMHDVRCVFMLTQNLVQGPELCQLIVKSNVQVWDRHCRLMFVLFFYIRLPIYVGFICFCLFLPSIDLVPNYSIYCSDGRGQTFVINNTNNSWIEMSPLIVFSYCWCSVMSMMSTHGHIGTYRSPMIIWRKKHVCQKYVMDQSTWNINASKWKMSSFHIFTEARDRSLQCMLLKEITKYIGR